MVALSGRPLRTGCWRRRVRAHLTCVDGRVVAHGRQLLLRIGGTHPSQQLIAAVRARILALLPEPAG